MPTIIAFHPTGFEVRFDVDLGEIAGMVRRLEQRHYRPSRELSYTAEGLPFCPRHGVPMQKRTKQNDTWFSHKVTDPTSGEVGYCRGYASPSSPGFDIVTDVPIKASQLAENNGNGNGRSPIKMSNGELDVDKLNQALFG